MKGPYLICVGKLKDRGHLELELDYLKRLTPPGLQIIETRARDDDSEKEGQDVLKKIHDIEGSGGPRPRVIALTERGKLRSTQEFHQWLQGLAGQPLIFVIGGASGHGQEVLKRCDEELSLSPLTFPHKLARLLLIEQLYRAQTIKQGHPYHK